MPLFNKFTFSKAKDLNSGLLSGFLDHQDDEDVKKTHLFQGRYENIYLKPQHVPELASLIDKATVLAEKILNSSNLRVGYWFNYMPPGAITVPHTHNDDDELLSAAYYVYVPENSGDLILHKASERIDIQPRAGEFIFFKPDVPHEVSKNNSEQHRLSIAFNFGQVDDSE
jgi:quercetin dioxygenase-like cupin family protein